MRFDNNTNSNKAIVTNQFSPKKNGLAITSLTLGIITLISCWIIIVPIITGIAGAITGSISLIQKRDGENIAIAGIITSVLGSLLGTLFFVLFIFSPPM